MIDLDEATRVTEAIKTALTIPEKIAAAGAFQEYVKNNWPAIIAELRELRAEGWVLAREKRPEIGQLIVVYSAPANGMYAIRFDGNSVVSIPGMAEYFPITHWRALNPPSLTKTVVTSEVMPDAGTRRIAP